MKTDALTACNICLTTSEAAPQTIFVKATFKNEDIDVCTHCMPTIIHGAGDVKTNAQVKEALNIK